MTKITSILTKLVSKRIYFLLLAAAVVAFARIATWFFPLDSDHWIFFVVGNQFIHGQILYAEIWDHKPPLIFLLNGLMSLIFGDSIYIHRLFLTVWMLFELSLFYTLLIKILAGLQSKNTEIVAKIGLLGYAFWRNLSQFTSSGNNTENFGLIFLIGLYLAYLNHRDSKNWKWLFLTGILLSVLVFLKPNFIILSLPIWLDLGWDLLTQLFQKKWKTVPQSLSIVLVRVIILILPLIIQSVLWIWYFSAHNALWDFWFGFYEFSSKYLKSTWEGAVSGQTVFLLISAPFYLLYTTFLGILVWQSKQNLQQSVRRFVIISGLAGGVFILILGSFYAYYYLILMPALVLMAVAIDWSKLKKLSLIALILVIFSSSGASYLISLRQLYNGLAGPVAAEEIELNEVADYVKARTAKEDTIYAYVYGATFYALTDRQSASNYISGNVLILDYRENYGYDLNGRVIADLTEQRPPYVILYKENEIYEANEPLMEFFNKCYQPVKTWTNYQVLQISNCTNFQ